MLYKRYAGEFLSRAGNTWRCEILQEADSAFADIGELSFPASEPLVIEWSKRAKYETMCGSTATLTIISPGDRTYTDLYSIKPGRVRLDVYRDDAIYWSGCLDTEFYEEPYSSYKGYDVQLTFSDFGILERIPYNLGGNVSFSDIMTAAIIAARLNTTLQTCISTKVENGSTVPLDLFTISSENFFDEEGEASSYYDVVEAILQPLALRLVQRGGNLYVYDINALYALDADAIHWTSTDATLSSDEVFNNIHITFSPYARESAQTGELTYGDVYGPQWTNLTNNSDGIQYNGGSRPSGVTAPSECYSWYPDYSDSHRTAGGWDYNNISFTLFRSLDSNKCKGVSSIGAYNSYFKLQSMLGGSDSEGICSGFYTGGHGSLASNYPKLKGINPTQHNQSEAFTSQSVYVPKLSDDAASCYYVRLKMDLLYDPRYNPFEEAGDGNEKGNYDYLKTRVHFAFVPVDIVLKDGNGNVLYHYDNKQITQYARPADTVASTCGSWVASAPSFGDAWLSFYDEDNMLKSDRGCAIFGWKTNRQNFGTPRLVSGNLVYGTNNLTWFGMDSFMSIPDGQYIPYPPVGGYLEIKVYNGVYLCTFGYQIDMNDDGSADAYKKIRYQLYGLPEVAIVTKGLTLEEVTAEDVDYTGTLNSDAKESLDLDTKVGSMDSESPNARGVMMYVNGTQVDKLKRGDLVDKPENLLIATLCSQYANRMTILSGEASIVPFGLHCFKDLADFGGGENAGTDNIYFENEGETFAADSEEHYSVEDVTALMNLADQYDHAIFNGELVFKKFGGNRKYMLLAESQDIITDCGSMTFCEIRPDEYSGS